MKEASVIVWSRRPLLAGLMLSIVGCQGSEPANLTGVPDPVPTTLSLSESALSFSALLEDHRLTATVRDQNGSVISGAPVTWTSSNAESATVSPTGLVVAVANGSAIVTATSGAASATTDVTVEQTPGSVSVSGATLTLTSLGDTTTLSATVQDAGGSEIDGAPLAWSSSDADVASVDDLGLVTAVAPGVASITATSGPASDTLPMAVEQVATSVSLSPGSIDLAGPGDTASVSASVTDGGGSVIATPDLLWSSDDEAVATVSDDGLVTAVASGGATVTAMVDGEAESEGVAVTIADGLLIGPAGGLLSAAGGAVAIDVPPGALAEELFITAEPATDLPTGAEPVPGSAFDFGPDGLSFEQSVRLTITYDPADVPAGVAEDDLRLHELVDDGYALVEGSTVDVVEHTVTGEVDGFSVYAALQRLAVTTTSLPDGSTGVPYSETLTAVGGGDSYSWTVASGSLPPGLALAPGGTLSGTPSVAGTWDFTVEATDGTETVGQALSISVSGVLLITTASLPNAILGVAYDETLTAGGGDGTYAWALASGSGPLPAGLSLGADGGITGTPSVAGTSDFTVEVTSGLEMVEQALSITTLAALDDGVSVSGLAGSQGQETYFVFTVPPSAPVLEVVMSGGTGDADVYVRQGALPTPTEYHCRPFTAGNDETCTFASPGTGDWFILVRGFTAYSGVMLTVMASLNLEVELVHLNQGNQSPGGSAGGVAQRPALLRVAVRANVSNMATPDVRVRLYQGVSLLRDELVPAPRVGVPVAPGLENLTDTWNVPLAASDVVPGLEVEVVVDPAGAFPEANTADNVYPPGGGSASLDVQVVPPLDVVFIPIDATFHGTVGDVNAGNTDVYLDKTWKWIPTSSITTSVRQSFTTSEDLSTEGGWSTLLSDIQALRTLEGATDEYYHGIVGDFAGIAFGGLAYRPISPSSSSRSGLSYDRQPFSAATVAHELGHNFGRRHAPCGNPGNPDPGYPYADAAIGVPGYDIVEGTLISSSTSDYMSYCAPEWTSDYTYTAIRTWRLADPLAAGPAAAAAASGRTSSGLLVWGRITSGGVTLNPAFAMEAAPALPTAPGENALRGYAADGRELFGFTFAAAPVADGEDSDERHFAFFVPLDDDGIEAVERIVVTTPRGVATTASGAGPAEVVAPAEVAPDVALSPMGGGRFRLQWDATQHPMVLVRDAVTGEVLTFARGGDAVASAGSLGLDRMQVLVSDGTRTQLLDPR